MRHQDRDPSTNKNATDAHPTSATISSSDNTRPKQYHTATLSGKVPHNAIGNPKSSQLLLKEKTGGTVEGQDLARKAARTQGL